MATDSEIEQDKQDAFKAFRRLLNLQAIKLIEESNSRINNDGQLTEHGNNKSLWDALGRKLEDVDCLTGLLADPLMSASSRSIALIAYAKKTLEEQDYPLDISDLEKCRKVFRALPAHRRNCYAPNEAMSRAEKIIEQWQQ